MGPDATILEHQLYFSLKKACEGVTEGALCDLADKSSTALRPLYRLLECHRKDASSSPSHRFIVSFKNVFSFKQRTEAALKHYLGLGVSGEEGVSPTG